jgi:hypothetical protein
MGLGGSKDQDVLDGLLRTYGLYDVLSILHTSFSYHGTGTCTERHYAYGKSCLAAAETLTEAMDKLTALGWGEGVLMREYFPSYEERMRHYPPDLVGGEILRMEDGKFFIVMSIGTPSVAATDGEVWLDCMELAFRRWQKIEPVDEDRLVGKERLASLRKALARALAEEPADAPR